MNANKVQETVKVKKDTKRKIRVEFDRTPLLERLKNKYISSFFLQKVIWYAFRLLFLIGVSYVILFPFIAKIFASFMSMEDFVDVTVQLIPKTPTLATYSAIITQNNYFSALLNTTILAGSCALIQMFVCCLIGYGFAKFKFKGNGILFALVIFTMIIPHATIQLSMFMHFRYFDIAIPFTQQIFGEKWGIFKLLNMIGITKHPYVNLLFTYFPLWILSITALGFKNGLYIFMLRQFFKGVPDELEESAYIDGSGVFRTFIKIVLPLSGAMLITVFLFAFAWQWTDNFYVDFIFGSKGPTLMDDIIKIPRTLSTNYAGGGLYESAIKNTCGLLIIAPLLILYLFGQRYIVQGIERSGITG